MGTDYNSIDDSHFVILNTRPKDWVLVLSTRKGYANDTSQWNFTAFFLIWAFLYIRFWCLQVNEPLVAWVWFPGSSQWWPGNWSYWSAASSPRQQQINVTVLTFFGWDFGSLCVCLTKISVLLQSVGNWDGSCVTYQSKPHNTPVDACVFRLYWCFFRILERS